MLEDSHPQDITKCITHTQNLLRNIEQVEYLEEGGGVPWRGGGVPGRGGWST